MKKKEPRRDPVALLYDRGWKNGLFNALNYLLLGLFAFACIYPFIFVIASSFNEGTDVTLPLKHSTEMLHKKGYENADVLIISDFIMETLPENLKKSIDAEKEKGTKFYSLEIGSEGNRQVTECFDRNWLYNTGYPHAQRHLVEQLHELKNREL